jgi:hypothetical protein
MPVAHPGQAALVKKAGEEMKEPPSGKRATPAAPPERNVGFVLAPTGKCRLRDSLLGTSGREGSTQVILNKRFMVFHKPSLELACE